MQSPTYDFGKTARIDKIDEGSKKINCYVSTNSPLNSSEPTFSRDQTREGASCLRCSSKVLIILRLQIVFFQILRFRFLIFLNFTWIRS